MIKKRCLVIGSSMTMPSFDLKYEDTWLYLLMQAYPNIEFVDKSRRAPSAIRLITEGTLSKGYDLLEYYSPNYVIIQLGLNDASPRLLKRNTITTRLINHLPFSNLIYNFIRRTRGRTLSCSDLTPEQYYNCFDNYLLRASEYNVIVFCFKIAYTTNVVREKSPRIIEAINMFNNKLEKLSKKYSNFILVDAFDDSFDFSDMVVSDGIHPNIKGSQFLFHKIKYKIDEEINKEDSIGYISHS